MIFRQLFDSESSTYTYLLADAITREAVIIDPVREQWERDFRLIRELDLTLRYSLETHVHADHVTGGGALAAITGAKLGFSRHADVQVPHMKLEDGRSLVVGRIEIRVLETPGHTKGCVSYLVDERMVFTGDALFIRGCGRTDFQDGDPATLYRSITEKLFKLPDAVRVFPAHDYNGHTSSTIGEEKRHNPRLAAMSQDAFVKLMNNLDLPEPKKIMQAVPANQEAGLEGGLPPSSAEEVSVDFACEHRCDFLILDVRGEDEFHGDLGHIPGALNQPLAKLDGFMEVADKERPTLVICRSGRRSMDALKKMKNNGFEKVWNVAGGMMAWEKLDLPCMQDLSC